MCVMNLSHPSSQICVLHKRDQDALNVLIQVTEKG